jgi:hypothetical protein
MKRLLDAMFLPIYCYGDDLPFIEAIKSLRREMKYLYNRCEWQWNQHFAKERFICPISQGTFQLLGRSFSKFDYWRKQGRDRCCSYCGSWHFEEFMIFVKQVIVFDGRRGTLELNDSKTKIYVEQPNVHNSDEGAVKFKLAHIPVEKWKDSITLNLINRALAISHLRFKEKISHVN